MKKRHILSVMAAILVLFGTPSLVVAGEKVSDDPFPGFSKLDIRMRTAWQQEMSMGEMDVLIPCLVRVTKPITEEKKEDMKDAGLEIKAVLESIISGRVLLANLPDLVRLDFVVSVEGAVPVKYKKGLKRGVWKHN